MTAKPGENLSIIAAYVACIAAGGAVLYAADLAAPWDALLADLAATLVIFAFSKGYGNSSTYDPYWSVIPPLLAVYWYCAGGSEQVDPARAICVMALVWLWGIRLTANWAMHWGGMKHEDWRYPMVRRKAGKAAFWADLLGIHLYPTMQVFLGCLPIYAVMAHGGTPLGMLDLIAAALTLGAIAIETIADLQLHAFTANRRPGTFIQSGLWGWSRHPNYFGQLSFWWGLMLFGLAAAPQAWWWIVPGAVTMSAMFVFASVPLMDQRSLERRPGFDGYMRRVSAIVPMPPKRRG